MRPDGKGTIGSLTGISKWESRGEFDSNMYGESNHED